MATLRELKGRIGSVASTEKITGAMKMISSAKMHKAESDLRRLVPFRSQISTIIGHLLNTDVSFSSPLVEAREVKSVAIIVLGSDSGLCGAYNINLYKRTVERIAQLHEQYGFDLPIDIIPAGKKIEKAILKAGGKNVTVAPETDINSHTDGDRCNEFMISLENKFVSGQYDRVEIIYTHYYTSGRQRILNSLLLPVDAETFTGTGEGKEHATDAKPCLFEPSAGAVFQATIPLFLMAAMQEYFAQNRASEQAARVMAMHSANDNAKKLLEELRLEYNKLRQQSITTELLDIVGGQSRD